MTFISIGQMSAIVRILTELELYIYFRDVFQSEDVTATNDQQAYLKLHPEGTLVDETNQISRRVWNSFTRDLNFMTPYKLLLSMSIARRSMS